MTCLQTSIDATYRSRPTPPFLQPPRTTCIFRLMETAVAATFAVPLKELQASTRCRADVAFARQVTMYLARVVLGMRYSAIGRACGRDHTTVAHACHVVEQRRDDPATNRVLHTLEHLSRDIAGDVAETSRVRT